MSSNSLLKLSLSFSLIGVFLLLILSLTIQPEQITTKNINQSKGYVKLQGKIISQRSYDEFSLLTLEDSYGKVQVSCFECKNFVNKSVIIEGRIEEYQGRKQIQAEKISIKESDAG